MSKSNKRGDLEYARLFHTSVKEYKAVVDALEETTDENRVTKLKIKMMLLRKYISDRENVQIKSIVPKLKNLIPGQATIIAQYYTDFTNETSKKMIHVNALGEEQDVRAVFNDITYGYYLHADFDKVERLRNTNQTFLWVMVDGFIESIEEIIFKLDNLILDQELTSEMSEPVLPCEPVIRYKEVPENKKNKQSGVWANLIADEITDDALKDIVASMSEDDFKCMLKAQEFMDALGKETVPTVETMRSIVLEERIQDWEDFTRIHEIIAGLKDCGLSTRVEYGENGQEASIKLFREVGEGFIISDPQLVHVPTIELCLNSSGEWRVFGFAI
ncbi:hypothetical protein SSM_02652 [Enterococcus faecium EnGen0192]|uniref:Uncharacterized protein n=4 Tax=Enterococcus faecium TaxID=1352 RepID=A0A829FAP9_ENTFC|nr:hypothetical protein [Enterococcus faecium]EOM20087.1 hypothetical protein SSM_02652 [Enterococcus faecium EnGen0192]